MTVGPRSRSCSTAWPPEAAAEVAEHLRAMTAEQGLPRPELLVVPETGLEDGRLPAAALAPCASWLDELAADANGRAAVVRRTLTGALESLPRRVELVTARSPSSRRPSPRSAMTSTVRTPARWTRSTRRCAVVRCCAGRC